MHSLHASWARAAALLLASAPAPADGTWSLPRGFSLDVAAQFFVLSIDGYDGRLKSYCDSPTRQVVGWNWY